VGHIPLYYSFFTPTRLAVMKLVWKRPNSQKEQKCIRMGENISWSNWIELNKMICDHYENEKLSNTQKQLSDEKKRIL